MNPDTEIGALIGVLTAAIIAFRFIVRATVRDELDKFYETKIRNTFVEKHICDLKMENMEDRLNGKKLRTNAT